MNLESTWIWKCLVKLHNPFYTIDTIELSKKMGGIKSIYKVDWVGLWSEGFDLKMTNMHKSIFKLSRPKSEPPTKFRKAIQGKQGIMKIKINKHVWVYKSIHIQVGLTWNEMVEGISA